ncbi:MAG: NPCBM/NEW2 domain-containing protein [Lachnospiraceae bacterium]|nr:NPCBM/NEW2 domain-containing protein [Lachnospiraceae bacterium]
MKGEGKKVLITAIATIIAGVLGAVAGGVVTHIMDQKTIEKSIVEILSEKFDSVDENMSYRTALENIYEDSKEKGEMISSLTEEKQSLEDKNNESENNNKELQSIVDDLNDQLNSAENLNEMIQEAKSYAASEQYDLAINLLEGLPSQSNEAVVLLKDYKIKYESQVAAQISAHLKSEEYDKAEELIDYAIIILPDSSVFKDKKGEVTSARPSYLLDVVKPYETKNYIEKIAGEIIQMGGIEYYNGFELQSITYRGYAIFNLNEKYTKISGIIGHVDSSGDKDKILKIYTDGILVDTMEIKYQELPRTISINVSGIKQLKFEVSPALNLDSCKIGFAELMVH